MENIEKLVKIQLIKEKVNKEKNFFWQKLSDERKKNGHEVNEPQKGGISSKEKN